MAQWRNVVVLVLLAAVALVVAAGSEPSEHDPVIREQFDSFVLKFGKKYSTDAEYNHRLDVFARNLARNAALNAKHAGKAQFGVTQFADMTQEEFKSRMLMRDVPLPSKKRFIAPDYTALGLKAPSQWDWRNKTGVVTPVYNQGQCGSCWAFSATENIESQWALAGHPLTQLAMQQIVDCDDGDYGCSGGFPSDAYEYVISAGGLEPLSDYPYTAADGNCNFVAAEVAAKISDWTYTTTSSDENQMANYLVQHGPISVCVDASEWSSYTSGVFTADMCGTSIDHCVLAVGYNLAANPPYWIIRNSWGTSWGINGYMYLEFGQDACAVADQTTSAIV